MQTSHVHWFWVTEPRTLSMRMETRPGCSVGVVVDGKSGHCLWFKSCAPIWIERCWEDERRCGTVEGLGMAGRRSCFFVFLAIWSLEKHAVASTRLRDWSWSVFRVVRALHWLAQALAEPEQEATQQEMCYLSFFLILAAVTALQKPVILRLDEFTGFRSRTFTRRCWRFCCKMVLQRTCRTI